MKKIILTLIVLLSTTTAVAQRKPVKVMYQDLWPVDTVRVAASCHVDVVTDTTDCVVLLIYDDSPSLQPDSLFFYRSTLLNVASGGTLTVLPTAKGYGITVGSSNKHVVVEYVTIDPPSQTALPEAYLPPLPRTYRFDDRMFYKIMGGWSNWGDGILNGIAGIDPTRGDGAYSISPAFNSWGLELNYAFVMHERWSLGIGLGANYHQFNFTNPYVYYYSTETTVGFRQQEVVNRGGWLSQVRDISIVLPLQLNLYAQPSHVGFFCQLELIPGISLPAEVRQTYSSNENGFNTSTRSSLKVWDNNLLRLNARLSLNWGAIGMYMESSLIPLFHHMDINEPKTVNLFPVHFGVSLDLSRLSTDASIN